MKDFRKISTAELWNAIEQNTKFAQQHTGWLQYLDNIKVLCALIDECIEVFQRQRRTQQLIQQRQASSSEILRVSPMQKNASRTGGVWTMSRTALDSHKFLLSCSVLKAGIFLYYVLSFQ